MPPLPSTKRYICPTCQHVHDKWFARCVACAAWHLVEIEAYVRQRRDAARAVPAATLVAVAAAPPAQPPQLSIVPPPVAAKPPQNDDEDDEGGDEDGQEHADDGEPDGEPVALCDIEETTYEYNDTQIAAVDYVLGGGIVAGQVIVLYGEPGCGKSTLLLQMLDGLHARCLYATGEETVKQAGARAHRINTASKRVLLVEETILERVFATARKSNVEVVAIDSIHTMRSRKIKGAAGSPSQIKECANAIKTFAKETEIAVIIIGHVTTDGTLSGPHTLKHLVDTSLEITNGIRCNNRERIIRCPGKNRFGESDRKAYLELTKEGFVPLAEPSPTDAEDDDGDSGRDEDGN